MSHYRIDVTFLDAGQVNVQAEGNPYPLGLYNETGRESEVLIAEAWNAIVMDRCKRAVDRP